MDPFNDAPSECLYNIATGQAVSKETEEFLLSLNGIGGRQRKQFIHDCIESSQRFEARFRKEKISTFATEKDKKKVVLKDGKIKAACT